MIAVALARSILQMDLIHSADVQRVPTRALLAKVNVGTPNLESSLMVDFRETDIILESCLDSRSYTYVDRSDFVSLDPRMPPKRLPVVDHCQDIGMMPKRYYDNCLSSRCKGVLGLSRNSTIWHFWSTASININQLLIGSQMPDGVRIPCLRGTTGLCDIRATIGGFTVDVSVHVDNAYTYVPQRLYEQLRDGRSDLVIRPTDSNTVIRIPANLFEHTPGSWLYASATRAQDSAASYRGSTFLIKPWNQEDRVSVGNILLTQYTLHLDVADSSISFEQRRTRERMTIWLAIGWIGVFFTLMKSVTESNSRLAWFFVPRQKRPPPPSLMPLASPLGVLFVSLLGVVYSYDTIFYPAILYTPLHALVLFWVTRIDPYGRRFQSCLLLYASCEAQACMALYVLYSSARNRPILTLIAFLTTFTCSRSGFYLLVSKRDLSPWVGLAVCADAFLLPVTMMWSEDGRIALLVLLSAVAIAWANCSLQIGARYAYVLRTSSMS